MGQAELREFEKLNAHTIANAIASPGLCHGLGLCLEGFLKLAELTIHRLEEKNVRPLRGTIAIDE
jgi:hypothetical protein